MTSVHRVALSFATQVQWEDPSSSDYCCNPLSSEDHYAELYKQLYMEDNKVKEKDFWRKLGACFSKVRRRMKKIPLWQFDRISAWFLGSFLGYWLGQYWGTVFY